MKKSKKINLAGGKKAYLLPKKRPFLVPLEGIGYGWVLAFVAVLAFLNFHAVVKTEGPWIVPWPSTLALLCLGLGGMVWGYRRMSGGGLPGPGRKWAWPVLGAILAAGAFLRLYGLGHPPGPFWDDWATNFVWVHQILDKDKFFWMMPSDGIEPFVPYCMAAAMGILPDEVKDLVVRRIASVAVDLVALWVLYLCGKELGSRRLGLIAAALGALGRPMIQLTITGMRAFSLGLAVGFLALTSLKLFRKPSLGHFIGWGLALAFGVHTYSSYRVLMMAVPVLILPWVLRRRREGETAPWAWFGAAGSLFLLAGVYSGTFAVTFPALEPWRGLWDSWTGSGWLMFGLFGACLGPSLFAVWRTRGPGRVDPLAGWSLGLGMACLLIYPMTLSIQFNGRMGVLSPFRDEDVSNYLPAFFGGQVWQTLRSLFYACKDRNDLQIASDPFYDIFTQGALLFGFAFFLARPGWKKAFLLALGALGTAVYVLSFDPASTKLIASAPPMYLLAAWGIETFWSGLDKAPRRGRVPPGRVFLLAALVYALFGGYVQFGKIHGFWFHNDMLDAILARQVGADERGNRVYLAPSDYFFGWNSQAVLNEGRRYYILKESNSIPLVRDEKPEDVVIYVYGSNGPLISRLKGRYAGASWEKVFVFRHVEGDPNPELYMWRVRIPAGGIGEDPKDVLYFQEDGGDWVRRYYNNAFGWGLPGILREERTLRISDPLPSDWLGSQAVGKFVDAKLLQMLGKMAVERDGEYEWSVRFEGPLWLRVDGRTVCRWDRSGDGGESDFKVHLDKGDHRVEILVRFPESYPLPQVKWSLEGSGLWKEL